MIDQPATSSVHSGASRIGSRLAHLAVVAAFAAAFVAARVPFAAAPQWGEEGMFAHLFLYAPPGPNYLLTARVSGAQAYCAPEHPAPLYEAVKLGGTIFRLWFPGWQDFSEARLTALQRMAFSMLQLLVFVAIVWATLRRDRGRFPSGAILLLVAFELIVALSPLAIRASTALQIDGASGMLFVGVLPVVLLAHGLRPMSRRAFLSLAFVGAFMTGLGKHEWSIALWLALLAMWGGAALYRRAWGSPVEPHGRAVGAILAGNVAGNLLSFLYDRFNWLGGLNVMTRIAREPGQGNVSGLRYQLDLMGTRMPFLFVVLLLILLLAVSLPAALRRGQVWSSFLGAYGIVLTLGFFISWRTSFDPRYFAPGMVALLCAIVTTFPLEGSRVWQRALAVLVSAGIAVPSAIVIAQRVKAARSASAAFEDVRNYVDRRREASGCIPILPPAYAYRPPTEFVSGSVPEDYATATVRQHGRTLCPPR